MKARKLRFAHWYSDCAQGAPENSASLEVVRHGKHGNNEGGHRVRLCPHCLKRCPMCQRPLVVDCKASYQWYPCRRCGVFLNLWLDWDGSVQWWGQVRDVTFHPYQDWAGFRARCLEQLHATRHVAIRELADASILVFFCKNARSARELRNRPRNKLTETTMWATSWIGFVESAKTLVFSFERGIDSPERKDFVLWCLQRLGPFRIHFDSFV